MSETCEICGKPITDQPMVGTRTGVCHYVCWKQQQEADGAAAKPRAELPTEHAPLRKATQVTRNDADEGSRS